MKVDEFRIKLKSVSDRRLERMLETVESQGPAEALQWIKEEKRRRESATFHASPAGKKEDATASLRWEEPRWSISAEELSSQIRPLSEVLGEPYVFYGKAEVKASLPSGNATLDREQGLHDNSETQTLHEPNTIGVADLGAQNGFEDETIDDLKLDLGQNNTPRRVSRGLLMVKAFVFLICLLGAVILGAVFLLRMGQATR